MGNITPLIIAGPAGDSLGYITGQEFTAAHMVHMVVQRDFTILCCYTGRTVWNGIRCYTQLVCTIYITVG